MEATAVPKGQADALEVSDVLKLHAALRDRTSCPWDRASAGYLVTCLYSRARASDFLRVSHVEFDNHGEFELEPKIVPPDVVVALLLRRLLAQPSKSGCLRLRWMARSQDPLRAL